MVGRHFYIVLPSPYAKIFFLLCVQGRNEGVVKIEMHLNRRAFFFFVTGRKYDWSTMQHII